jgi:DNA-binding NtrC family response regulator
VTGKVVIVDDSSALRNLLATFLEDLGLEAVEAGSGREGLAAVSEHRPQLVLLDLVMPDMTGIQVLKEIKARYPEVMVLMISGISDEETAREAIALGAYDYITKPIELGRLETEFLNRIFA